MLNTNKHISFALTVLMVWIQIVFTGHFIWLEHEFNASQNPDISLDTHEIPNHQCSDFSVSQHLYLDVFDFVECNLPVKLVTKDLFKKLDFYKKKRYETYQLRAPPLNS